MKRLANNPTTVQLARNFFGGIPRGIHFDRPTLVPQAAANTAGLTGNPAYKTNNINDYVPFDTLTFQRDVAEYPFFQSGAGVNGKTRFDTNMITGANFPLGRNVVVHGIGFHLIFSGAAASTRAAQVQAFYTILERSYLQLTITGREFEFQAPGSWWMPEIALSNEVSNTSTSVSYGEAYQRVGDYIKHGGFALKIPITLQNLVPFTLPWFVDTSDAGVQAALQTLTPTSAAAAKLRWHFKATLEQGT